MRLAPHFLSDKDHKAASQTAEECRSPIPEPRTTCQHLPGRNLDWMYCVDSKNKHTSRTSSRRGPGGMTLAACSANIAGDPDIKKLSRSMRMSWSEGPIRQNLGEKRSPRKMTRDAVLQFAMRLQVHARARRRGLRKHTWKLHGCCDVRCSLDSCES